MIFRPFKCDSCQKTFYRSNLLTKHLLVCKSTAKRTNSRAKVASSVKAESKVATVNKNRPEK